MLKPQSIALPAVVHGQFAKAGDVDSFAFKMKAGQTLVAAMDAYTAGVSMDALMLLRDARGVKLAFNHDAHSLDPRLTGNARRTAPTCCRWRVLNSRPTVLRASAVAPA